MLASVNKNDYMMILSVTPIFKDKMECITLCAPRDQLHISRQIKEEYHHNAYYIMIINSKSSHK
jgi:hypothetical protein